MYLASSKSSVWLFTFKIIYELPMGPGPMFRIGNFKFGLSMGVFLETEPCLFGSMKKKKRKLSHFEFAEFSKSSLEILLLDAQLRRLGI